MDARRGLTSSPSNMGGHYFAGGCFLQLFGVKQTADIGDHFGGSRHDTFRDEFRAAVHEFSSGEQVGTWEPEE